MALIEAQHFGEAWELLAGEFSRSDCEEPNLLHARVLLASELARYADVISAVSICARVCPGNARHHYDFLKGAFAASMCLQHDLAMEFFGRQFGFLDDDIEKPDSEDIEKIRDHIAERTVATLYHKILTSKLRNTNQTIGIFFLSSTEALGHAILDPYHFLALHRSRFDQIIFVGPDPGAYRPASRACLAIVEQYGTYVSTHDQMLLNLSWMSLGSISVGPVELIIENYWSLLRQVTHRTRDAADPFEHNRWHMSLPKIFEEAGEVFCEKHGIDLEQPLVVLHVRESGYHGLTKQAFRDAEISDYERAIRHLLKSGYQVIRIGDTRMQRLTDLRDGYVELPFMRGYHPRLDPFFVARAAFMIGSQSGPCAYARALGRPVLSANAVYHYTLLPAVKELACFKTYLKRDKIERSRRLGPKEILNLRLSHFDNAQQFKSAGIELRSVSSTDILNATREMAAWCADPEQPERPEQLSFRVLTERVATDLEKAQDLLPPVGDYLGFSLPSYRVASKAGIGAEPAIGADGEGLATGGLRVIA